MVINPSATLEPPGACLFVPNSGEMWVNRWIRGLGIINVCNVDAATRLGAGPSGHWPVFDVMLISSNVYPLHEVCDDETENLQQNREAGELAQSLKLLMQMAEFGVLFFIASHQRRDRGSWTETFAIDCLGGLAGFPGLRSRLIHR